MLKSGTFLKIKYRKLFIAAVLGWIVCIVGEMADSLIAGLYLNPEAVSAVSLVTPIYSLIYCISLVLGIGTSIAYSRELGAYNVEKSRQIAGMGVISALCVGLVIGTILVVFKNTILSFYGCSQTVYEYASEYYFAYAVLGFFIPFENTVYYLVSNDGDENIILTYDSMVAIINFVLSFALVQRIGIKGLAYGTLFSYFAGIIILIPHFFKKSNSVHFKPYFNFKEFLDVIKLSSATASTQLYVALIDIIFNKIVITLFTDVYLPAYTVINLVLNLAMILDCSTYGAIPFITVYYGENNPRAIQRIMKLVFRNNIITSVALSISLFILSTYFPRIYGIQIPEVYESALFAGRVIAISDVIAGFVYVFISYYPATNNPFYGNVSAFSYMFLGPVVLAAPLAKFFGFKGLSIGFAATSLFALLVLFIFIALKKDLKRAPLILDPTDEDEFACDIELKEEGIISARNECFDFLKSHNVSSNVQNEVCMILEDSLMIIKNKNKKDVICEVSILVNDEHVRLITKDNGIIFDIIQEADNSKDLSAYITARMMATANESNNTTTISFNRNTYVWNL